MSRRSQEPEQRRQRRLGNLEHSREVDRQWRLANLDRRREYRRQWDRLERVRLRAAAVAHYGGTCACCGGGDRFCIAVTPDSGVVRPPGIATQVDRWLARNDYPPGFHVLCVSCAISSGHAADGVCRLPHERA